MNSRAKGKAGELEAKNYFKERGYAEATRGQQRKGGAEWPLTVGRKGRPANSNSPSTFGRMDMRKRPEGSSSAAVAIALMLSACLAFMSSASGLKLATSMGGWIKRVEMRASATYPSSCTDETAVIGSQF